MEPKALMGTCVVLNADLQILLLVLKLILYSSLITFIDRCLGLEFKDSKPYSATPVTCFTEWRFLSSNSL